MESRPRTASGAWFSQRKPASRSRQD